MYLSSTTALKKTRRPFLALLCALKLKGDTDYKTMRKNQLLDLLYEAVSCSHFGSGMALTFFIAWLKVLLMRTVNLSILTTQERPMFWGKTHSTRYAMIYWRQSSPHGSHLRQCIRERCPGENSRLMNGRHSAPSIFLLPWQGSGAQSWSQADNIRCCRTSFTWSQQSPLRTSEQLMLMTSILMKPTCTTTWKGFSNSIPSQT